MNGMKRSGKPGIVQAMQIPPTLGQPPMPPTQPRIGTLHFTTGPLQPSLTRHPRWVALAEAGKLRNRSGDPYKPSALRGYRRDLEKRIIPALGPVALAAITAGDLQRLVDRWELEGMSPSSIRNALLPLRALYRYHAARDGITTNPRGRSRSQRFVGAAIGSSARPRRRR
jgi:hypothetical protein